MGHLTNIRHKLISFISQCLQYLSVPCLFYPLPVWTPLQSCNTGECDMMLMLKLHAVLGHNSAGQCSDKLGKFEAIGDEF